VKKKKQGTTKRKSAKKRHLGQYKSGLEKSCADMLRSAKVDFLYEQKEYVLQEKFRHEGVYHKMTLKSKDMADRTGNIVLSIKYTPDFVAPDNSWIIETKGFTPSHHDFTMRWKLFLKLLNDSDEPLPALFICKNNSQIEEAIHIIKNLQ
jgi:hypothetical protein